jgi:hypothetical protein
MVARLNDWLWVDSGRSDVGRKVAAARTAAFIDWTNLFDCLAARVTQA